MEYIKYNHSAGANFWHLQWCPKYRYNMFKEDYYKNICTISIMEACKRYNITTLALNVQSNHIHIVVSLSRGMTEIKAIALIKGFTSYLIFRLEPKFRLRYPRNEFWADGYFAATIGHSDLTKTILYVENQDNLNSGNYGL